jgi:hypothetical protein
MELLDANAPDDECLAALGWTDDERHVLHDLDDLGLPYAAAAFDPAGYHLICPVCGFQARAEGGATEDAVTKGAARAYQAHYAAAARRDAGTVNR